MDRWAAATISMFSHLECFYT